MAGYALCKYVLANENAGVGGSTPFLATIILKHLPTSHIVLPVHFQSAPAIGSPVGLPFVLDSEELSSECLASQSALSPLSLRFGLPRD